MALSKDELFETKKQIIDLIKSTGIDDIDYFIHELEESGYFTAPASMNGHLAFEGGLMCHSLNVYEAALELKKSFAPIRSDIFEDIPDTSIIIAALLHDMCKANLYFRKKMLIDQTKGEYGTNDAELPVGHGEKSVIMLLQMGLPMTNAEICAIRWHMGAWSVNDANSEERSSFKTAVKNYPLVTLIQLADTIAANFIERPPRTIN